MNGTQEMFQAFQELTVWALPLIFAITLHEAAHGLVAYLCGDRTAWMLGRVTLNPIKHIDPVGTILFPGLAILSQSGFLFGWAKPVPVNFRALRHLRRDMVLVALAGPGINVLLATVSMALLYVVPSLPVAAQVWAQHNLANSVQINLLLAVFNMLPIPPLDGGRVLVGLLPPRLARPLAALEEKGMLIVLFLFFVLPMLGRATHMDLGFASMLIAIPYHWLLGGLAALMGFA